MIAHQVNDCAKAKGIERRFIQREKPNKTPFSNISIEVFALR
jgi:hypothetical protein